MNIGCDMTRDLLAVYLDGECSQSTKEAVEEHLKSCQDCSDILAELSSEAPSVAELDMRKKRILQNVKRRFSIKKWATSCVSVAACAALFVTGITFSGGFKAKSLPTDPDATVGETETDTAAEEQDGYILPEDATLNFAGYDDLGEPIIVARSYDGLDLGRVPTEYCTVKIPEKSFIWMTYYRIGDNGQPIFYDQPAKCSYVDVEINGKNVLSVSLPESLPSEFQKGWGSQISSKEWLLNDPDKGEIAVDIADLSDISLGFAAVDDATDRLQITVNNTEKSPFSDAVKIVPNAFEVFEYYCKEDYYDLATGQKGVAYSGELDKKGGVIAREKWADDGSKINSIGSFCVHVDNYDCPLETVTSVSGRGESVGFYDDPSWDFRIQNGEFLIDHLEERVGETGGWVRITSFAIEHADGTRSELHGEWIVEIRV